MGQPPQTQDQDQHQEQHQEQSVQACSVSDDGPCHIPATPFEVFKSRCDAHPFAILLHAVTTSRPIGEQHPGLLLLRVPDRTEVGGQVMLLPDQGWTDPLLPAPLDQATTRAPVSGPATSLRLAGVVA